MHRGLLRRMMALLTALAVGLSLFVPVMAVASISGGGDVAFATLCSGQAAPGDNDPARKGPACPCCALMCAACHQAGSMADGDRPFAAIAYAPRENRVVFSTAGVVEPLRRNRVAAHSARAPPESGSVF